MPRFFSSRTGALLTLGVLSIVVGFAAMMRPERPAVAPLASVTPPPAVCGNSRCEIGEKATTRILGPAPVTLGSQYDSEFGTTVISAGDLDSDGVSDLYVGARKTDTYNVRDAATTVTVKLNRDGTAKNLNANWTGPPVPGEILTAANGDLIINGADQYGYNRGVYRHLSNGVDVRLTMYPATGGAHLGDIDGNGTQDLAVGASGSGSAGIISILRFTAGSDSAIARIISPSADNLSNTLQFGRSVAVLGDVSGDGKTTIAVGANASNTPGVILGVVWILTLNSDGTVMSKNEIIPGQSFALGTVASRDVESFGSGLAGIGDWNGDGIPDLAVISSAFGTTNDSGRYLWIFSLNRDKTIKSTQIISTSDLGAFAGVFSALTSIPDMDGDGKKELIIGDAKNAACGGNNNSSGTQGAIHVFFSKSLDSCPKDCNWCVPSSTVTAGNASSQINMPTTYSPPPTCNNGSCGIKDLNPIPIPGATQNVSTTNTFQMPLIALGSASIADLGDFYGDGSPTVAVAGRLASYPAPSDPPHENELQILALRPNGTIKSAQRIFEGTAGLVTGDPLGPVIARTVAAIGDIDGDGVQDLAVTAQNANNYPSPSALWILFLKRDGTVKGFKKIAPGVSGFNDTIAGNFFGTSLAPLGDFDGDGIPDLAVSDVGQGNTTTPQEGFIHLLFLKRDGTVKSTIVLHGTAFTGPGVASAYFGSQVGSLGDPYQDGRLSLAVGNGKDGVWSIFLNRDGTVNSWRNAKLSFYDSNAVLGSMTDAGDQNGDGRPELAIAEVPSYSATVARNIAVHYFTVSQNGDLEKAGSRAPDLNRNVGTLSYVSGQPWNAIATIADLDGDGKRELLMNDGGAGYCPVSIYNNYVYRSGLVWLYLSGAQSGSCENDCNTVNFCSASYGASSSASRAASSVVSSTASSSSGVSSSASSPQWQACPQGYQCTRILMNNQCIIPDSPPPSSLSPSCTQVQYSGSCGTATCSGTCWRCAGSSSSSAGASSVVSSTASSVAVSSAAASSIASSLSFSSSTAAASSVASSVPSSAASSITASSVTSSVSSVISSSPASSAPSTLCGDGNLDFGEDCETGYDICSEGLVCEESTCLCVFETAASASSIIVAFPPEENASSEPFSRCGDGILLDSEQCETGYPCPNGGFCTANCQCQARSRAASSNGQQNAQVPRCGDGRLEGSEQCEVGQPCTNGGFCTVSCQCQIRTRSSAPPSPLRPNPIPNSPPHVLFCGNALLEETEECEIGSPCPDGLSCDLPQCRCVATVAGTVCGDGRIDTGEECELSTPCPFNWACDERLCRCNVVPVCGNGLLESLEECDDGNTLSNDGCSSFCQRETPSLIAAAPLCGNGLIEQGEECDDSNILSGDGCSSGCQREYPSSTSLLSDRGAAPSVDFVPTLISATPSLPTITPVLRPAANSSSSQQILVQQPLEPQPITIPFPTQQTSSITPSPQYAPTQAPAPWQISYAPYASIIPYAPSSGPAGKTGPASVAMMAAGAAAGFAWVRRRRRTKD